MIFVSTGAFPNLTVLEAFERLSDFEAVEISSGVFDKEQIIAIKNEAKKKKILLHNYSPPPKTPFVLNLGSLDFDIAELSEKFVINSIELSSEIESPIYAIHAGYCFDPKPRELGKKISKLELYDNNEVLKRFCDVYVKLQEYASAKGVRLLIENNVLSKANYQTLGREALLFSDTEGAEDLVSTIGDSVEFLIDFAHLKVSSNSLGFKIETFLKKCRNYSKAVHLSDTSRLTDDNKYIQQNSDLFQYADFWLDCDFITLEVYEDVSKIEESLNYIKKSIHEFSKFT